MKYLIETLVDFIKGECTAKTGKVVFVLPSYTSEILLGVGSELEEHFENIPGRKIQFKYGIAYKLGQKWQNSSSADRANFELVKNKGWYNEDDNLTEYRNTQKQEGYDNLVVVMAGYEYINDRESLRDFFHLDQHAVWNICLKKSFKSWLKKCLENQIDVDDSEEDINKIEDILITLHVNGLADLIRISSYLEQQDISVAMDGNDVYKLVLSNLSSFKLPRLIGLSTRYAKKKTFAHYLENSLNFFSYSMFLESNAREKIISKVNKFKEELGNGEIEQPDEDHLGEFHNIEEVVDTLKEYIEKRSEESKKKLYTVDFVFLLEKIIEFKKNGSTSSTKKNPKKLKGLPLDVFLRGIWLTLGDFKDELKSSSMFIGEDLKGITVSSISFRHDFEGGGDDDELSENEKAKYFLTQIIGGIDEFLKEHINIELDLNDEKVAIDFASNLSPQNNDDLTYKKSHTAEPWLKFQVIVHADQAKSIKREFTWALPPNHQCRIVASLIENVVKVYKGNALPAFGLPYMSEIFSASEEEEANRIMNTALQKNFIFFDLLNLPGIDKKDQVKKLLLDLSYSYQKFLLDSVESGFFSALNSQYDNLRRHFTNAYTTFLDSRSTSELAPILFKAFLIVSDEEMKLTDWGWRDNIMGAVVTPLHPALLEMIRHQHIFLCDSFRIYVQDALTQPKSKMLTEKSWSRVMDLATLNRPIYGVLEKNQILNTNAKSYGYLHLIGELHGDSTFLDSRLLLEYEEDEEDVTDAELFEETRTSRLVRQTLANYCELYPFARDGLSLGAYCGKDIQAVIAGIDSFLKQILSDEKDKEYTIALTVFSDSRDDSAVMRWINAWKDRWQAAELSSNKNYYSNCNISIHYKVVSSEESYSQFEKLLRDTEFDIMVFADFIKSDESKFVPLEEEVGGLQDYRKFPVLEKTCCKITGGGKDQQRERVLSNPRFRLGLFHAEVMAYLKSGTSEKSHAVISKSDYIPWIKVVDEAHKQSTWVVCIDPAIDEQLLYKDATKREIIGLGTGVGPHGENNFTVSTEKFSLVDIKQKISELIASLYEDLSHEDSEKVADRLVEQAFQIAGLSIVKATGPDRFIRELVANSIVRKLVDRDESVFCDEIISLDAFSHWFNDFEKRPDLLRVKARIVDGYFDIEAQIIECKLAMYNEGFLEKAREQIESGLRQLVSNFRPRGKTPLGIEEDVNVKPDQRYWWMQLHRLIANKGETDKSNYQKAILALERLSEGFYNIKWQAAAVAFWNDIDNNILEHNQEWQFNLGGQELCISVVSAGKHFIKAVSLEEAVATIFNDSALQYQHDLHTRLDKKIEIEEGDVTEEEKGDGEQKGESAIVTQQLQEEKVEVEKEIIEVKDKVHEKKLPDRILLGTYASGREIYWEFGHPDLPNRHILVFGASGTGKTYTIQALLCELSKFSQNSIIVDYTNGFTNKQLEPVVVEKLKPRQHIIRNEALALNPFRQQSDFIDDMELTENPTNTAQRVTSVFVEVYQLGDQQKSALYNAIRTGITKEGSSFTLAQLINELEAIQAAGGPTAKSAASVISKIQPFVDMTPFGEEDPESWEKLYNDAVANCHIIQLAGFAKDTSRLITEFSLIDLYWYYRAKGNKNDPKVIVLDEIQNLDHRLESPIGQFLTEGRKFGISLILATQTLSNLGKDERDRLFQAGHKLFFKPADTEVRSFAQILSDATGLKSEEWVERLTSLKRGECYSLGYAYNEQTKKLEVGKSFKIKIKALEERF
ncbi:ATP-binding protein [Dethiobacter alkaliphilus]|uniref:AAA ATPase n=1 Tax=Dethiobacter alkaliphilus AHT 1 TaxID=555088 RepID=C0GD40_DETAL|nr:ATP-binding protein [Dethiobacter alkaliphilus]EEG79125.1 AAA ATPase [Dethiobacter alkaliphilus AHT 1]